MQIYANVEAVLRYNANENYILNENYLITYNIRSEHVKRK